jgi:hypothetical protein
MGTFLRQYRRRAHKGWDPNDRGYDREIEAFLRKLKAEDLDVLLNGEEDERHRAHGRLTYFLGEDGRV